MDKRVKYLILTIVLAIAIISLSTYAWLTYGTNNTAMSLTIGEIDKVRITLNPYQFNGSVKPLSTYDDSNNKYVQISATNKATSEGVFSLYYHINSIASELRRISFKYTILRSTTTDADASYASYKEGNFSTAVDNIDFTILAGEVIPGNNTTYYYRVYIWINNSGYQSDMQGKIFDAELTARISQLPSAYQQVEYLESSGTQYINTGLNVSVGYQAELDGAFTTFVSNHPVYGAWNSGYSYLIIPAGTDKFNIVAGEDNSTYYSLANFDTNRHLFSIRNDGTYLDNVLLNPNVVYNFPNATTKICVFGAATGNNAIAPEHYRASFQLYSLIIKDRYNNVKRSFIPVYRKTDSVGGLYDTVNNTFYTNQGTGTFTYGNAL